jgi:hypothetical protein
MGEESNGSENQTTGYSLVMCPQTKERAEVMAVNSAVRRGLTSIEECEQLPPGNQIKVRDFHNMKWPCPLAVTQNLLTRNPRR